MTCSARRVKDAEKVFLILKTLPPNCYDETEKSTIAPVRYSCEGIFAFDTCSLFGNIPYSRAHMTETTGLLRYWKKVATAFRVSVSKLYVTYLLTFFL